MRCHKFPTLYDFGYEIWEFKYEHFVVYEAVLLSLGIVFEHGINPPVPHLTPEESLHIKMLLGITHMLHERNL
jgi:hypothetical protein